MDPNEQKPPSKGNPQDGQDNDDDKKPAAEEKTQEHNIGTPMPYTPSILRTPSVAGSSYSKYFVGDN